MEYHLPSPAEKSEYLQKKFGEIARHYDRFNDLVTLGLHRYWKAFLIERLGVQIHHVCVDLCCGSGDLSILLSKQTKIPVIAIDFTNEMLLIAQKRAWSSPDSIHWIQSDAIRIPLESHSVDTLTIGYGLRNVVNRDQCLQEVYRVLKPGGVFGCLDVGKVRNRWIAALHHFYFFKMVPWMGKILAPQQEMFDYLPHSSLEYPSQTVLKRQLVEIGFQQVDLFEFLFGASVIHVAYKPKGLILSGDWSEPR